MKLALTLTIVYCYLYSTADNDELPNNQEDSDDPNEIFTKCYENLGCIHTDSNWYHKTYRPINLRPADRHIIKTDFLLLKQSEKDPDNMLYNSLVANEASVSAAGFDNTSQLLLIIHDFTSNGYTGWIKNLAYTITKRSLDYNVVSVDWQRGAEPPYDQAVSNSRVVALEIIALLKELKESMHYNLDNIHIVGHGVGAHIAGYVGATYNKIRKITGLDPSGPRFQGMPPAVKLHLDCAKYVEVIHTDSGSQGSNESLGHSDFYINGGNHQPGCVENSTFPDLVSVDRSLLREGEILPGCSHKRSFKYFIEAISNTKCSFLGVKCDSFGSFNEGRCTSCSSSGSDCRFFGLKSFENSAQNVKFYLNSADTAPFCMFQYKITITVKGEHKQGFFDFILVDENTNAAEAVLSSDPSSNGRHLKPGENAFVYYAHPPKLRLVKEAKVRWNEKKKFYCVLFCTQSIHVEKIIVLHLGAGSEHQRSENILCPSDNETEIEMGAYKTFTPCAARANSRTTTERASAVGKGSKAATKKVAGHKYKC